MPHIILNINKYNIRYNKTDGVDYDRHPYF